MKSRINPFHYNTHLHDEVPLDILDRIREQNEEALIRGLARELRRLGVIKVDHTVRCNRDIYRHSYGPTLASTAIIDITKLQGLVVD